MAESGMISPQQLGVKVQQAQMEVQAQADLIRNISQEMVNVSTSQDQFIPGTQETRETLLAKQNATLEAQRKVQKVAGAADWENLSVVLGQDLAQLAHKQRAVNEKIIKDSSVSLFEDPLLALANAFTLPWDQQELDSIKQSIDVTSAAMQKVNTHVQQAAVTADRIKEDVTVAGIAQTTAAIENLFKNKNLAARMEAAKTNAATVEQVLRMDAARTDAYMKARQLADADENRRIAREGQQQRKKLFDAQIAKIEDEQKAEQVQLGLVNLALAKEGKNPIDIDGFKLRKNAKSPLLNELIQQGLDITINGGQNYTQGATIQDRFAFQKATNFVPSLPQQETVLVWQSQALNAAVTGATGTGKDKQIMASQNADTAFNTRWNQEQMEIREGSPFKAPAWKVLYAHAPEIASHPIWMKYIIPTLTDEAFASQSVDEKVLLKAATTAVLNKEVPSSEAAAWMAQVFKKSVAINNTVFEFKRIANRDQTKYGVRLDAGFGGKRTVDLTDQVQVTEALTAEIVQNMIAKDVDAFMRVKR